MKENSFYNKIHRLGRITVVCALISFMAVPFGLAAVNGISMNIPEILKNAIPLLLTFSISGICENLSFMPIIGSGALYMSCVTGNVSNMKVPAAVNAMEVAGYTAGSDRADVVAIIAVAASTFVTTAIVFLGMLFLAPLFEPIYNNAFLQPAFQNMVPALMGALLFPFILKAPKQAIVPIALPIIAILVIGRKVFSSNQSYIMVGVIILSVIYSLALYKRERSARKGKISVLVGGKYENMRHRRNFLINLRKEDPEIRTNNMDKKEFVLKAVADKKALIVDVSDKIFDYAEVGFHEFKTAKLYEEVLKKRDSRWRWESAVCRRRSRLYTEAESR